MFGNRIYVMHIYIGALKGKNYRANLDKKKFLKYNCSVIEKEIVLSLSKDLLEFL